MSAVAAVDRVDRRRARPSSRTRPVEQLLLAQPVDPAALRRARRDPRAGDEGVGVRDVVDGEDHRAGARDVLEAVDVDVGERAGPDARARARPSARASSGRCRAAWRARGSPSASRARPARPRSDARPTRRSARLRCGAGSGVGRPRCDRLRRRGLRGRGGGRADRRLDVADRALDDVDRPLERVAVGLDDHGVVRGPERGDRPVAVRVVADRGAARGRPRPRRRPGPGRAPRSAAPPAPPPRRRGTA